MRIFELIMVILQISTTMARKKHQTRHSSSEESIENLLYYKDCKHKPTATTIKPVLLQSTRTVPDCPCPRMCCSMCCDCSMPLPQSSYPGRPTQPIQQQRSQQMAPQMLSLRHPMPAQPNIGMGPDMGMMNPKRKKVRKTRLA
ncbi:uncharacterized protein LOC113237918 [Hyposmocoma kahamanoa]|uniref:uncharacterized protein LOC113237918 n=1 Tax=Hyposmocoma kahamanoa TaxID=1477025 RepID=UPI000E6DA06D|nr:uncharacterized protein LOC113237918 [Hyposmocoma kahamanoa]